MNKDWNDELMELESKDNLTSCQDVGISGGSREGWDLRWEIERLANQVKFMEKDIESLRFELAKEQYAKAMLIAELNAIRGKRKD
jgi:hypothetical protein